MFSEDDELALKVVVLYFVQCFVLSDSVTKKVSDLELDIIDNGRILNCSNDNVPSLKEFKNSIFSISLSKLKVKKLFPIKEELLSLHLDGFFVDKNLDDMRKGKSVQIDDVDSHDVEEYDNKEEVEIEEASHGDEDDVEDDDEDDGENEEGDNEKNEGGVNEDVSRGEKNDIKGIINDEDDDRDGSGEGDNGNDVEVSKDVVNDEKKEKIDGQLPVEDDDAVMVGLKAAAKF
uniref:Uncharacterized protein n=1 Tax=Cannabis sativa TaxID=3483 RepID=A0A803PX03_CANSA